MAGEDRISGNFENPRTDRTPDTDSDPVEVPAPPVPASGRFLDESNRLPMRKASRLPDLSAFNKESRGTAKNNDGGASSANNDGGVPAASRFKPDAVPGWGSPAPKPTDSAQADASPKPGQPGADRIATEHSGAEQPRADRPAPAKPRTGSTGIEESKKEPEPRAARVVGAAAPAERESTDGAAPLADPVSADEAAPSTKVAPTVATAADSKASPSTATAAVPPDSAGSPAPQDEQQEDMQSPTESAPGPNPEPNRANPGADGASEWQSSPAETVRAEKTRTRPGDKGGGATSVAAAAASSAVVGGAEGGAAKGAGNGPGAKHAAGKQAASKPNRPVLSDVERRAAEREEAVNAKPPAGRILQVMLAVFFPFLLIIGAIRAVCTPLFLWIEYNRPGFPADSFGFSTEDRMTYGSYAVDYLLNWAGPRYLGGLVGPDGEQLFLDSEVGHMADVKTVIMGAWIAGAAMLVLSVLAVIYLARKYPGGIRRGLFAGSAATLILIIVLGVLGALNWQGFFTAFHGVFFADGTWTFFVDDTLIRLFPAQFWMDAGIVIAVLVLMVSSLVLAFTWPTKSRRERSSEKLAAARARYLQDLREDF